jgi:hypothetical protein
LPATTGFPPPQRKAKSRSLGAKSAPRDDSVAIWAYSQEWLCHVNPEARMPG